MAWLSWFRTRQERQEVLQGEQSGQRGQRGQRGQQAERAGRRTTPVGTMIEGDEAESDSEQQFLWYEGRRHMTNVPYLLPKDGQEVSRLDFQHYMIRYALQRNFVAPVENPKGILDTGCGTGRWAQEMATAFPKAKVFGLDIIEESGENSTRPTNYRFVHGDVLQELPFPDMTFDYVHQRFMHMAIPVEKWPIVAKELVRVTRPGGWVEMVESDLVMRNIGPATQQLTQWGFELSKRRNIDPRICSWTPNFLFDAGLTNIQKYRLDLPIGSWGGRLGIMAVTDLYAFNRALRPHIMAQFGVSANEFDNLTNVMRQEWEAHHSYFSVYLACGQRPSRT